jgi:hypothetical protein
MRKKKKKYFSVSIKHANCEQVTSNYLTILERAELFREALRTTVTS